jgi:hypothetical protein
MIKNASLKHWLNSSGWKIVEAMHDVVFSKTMFIILEANYVVGSANDVTTIDALHWMNIHIHVMQN